MKKQNSVAMSYAHYLEQAKDVGEANDCAVRAVAVATGIAYKKVHEVMATQGRRRKSCTHQHVIKATLKELGYTYVPVRVSDATTIGGLETHLRGHGDHTPIMVFVRKHVATIHTGVVVDWASGRRHHIQKVWAVLKDGEALDLPSLKDNPQTKYTINRPHQKTKCGQLWELLDQLYEKHGEEVTEYNYWQDSEYETKATKMRCSAATIKAQHYRWRKFNGFA